jgi:hypothetical protein
MSEGQWHKRGISNSPGAPLSTAKTVLMRPIAACHVSVVPFILQCPVAMPPSSPEDRVRELCAQVAAAETEAELNVILP